MTSVSRLFTPTKLAFVVLVVLVGAFLILPTLVVIPVSFTSGRVVEFPTPGLSTQWYENAASNDAWRIAILTSIKVAIASTLLSVTIGTMAALAIERGDFPGRTIARLLVLSPLVTPVIVLAVAIFMVFSKIGIAGSFLGLVLSHSMLAMPLVFVAVTNSLKSMNANLELASRGLGATPLFTFRRVTLPLIMPGVVAGGLFSFITSWDEVVVAIFLTSPTLRTVPVLIWSQVRAELDPTIAVVGTVMILLTALGIAAVYGVMKAWRQA
jgi:putative spermidine/putrescine transport system permease protein